MLVLQDEERKRDRLTQLGITRAYPKLRPNPSICPIFSRGQRREASLLTTYSSYPHLSLLHDELEGVYSFQVFIYFATLWYALQRKFLDWPAQSVLCTWPISNMAIPIQSPNPYVVLMLLLLFVNRCFVKLRVQP
jgi:hypothetical protein